MTNDLKAASALQHDEDYRMLNVLGVAHSVNKGLRQMHTTFGGFRLFNLPVEQLICRVNMLMQHYHTSSNLSRKLDASLGYLQLQLGMPGNLLEYNNIKWGHLAPLSWVKMLWKSLHNFDIHLHMVYPIIAIPRERNQVVMEVFFSKGLSEAKIRSLGWCRVALKVLFPLDITTADGRYLEEFVFTPGEREKTSRFKFPREQSTCANRDLWFDFWHNFTTTGGKHKVPLGNWLRPMHCIWKWYYRTDNDDLQRIEGNTIFLYKPLFGLRLTRATKKYKLVSDGPITTGFSKGEPSSVSGLTVQLVTKLSEGPALPEETEKEMDFWEFLRSWGGAWMWDGVETGNASPMDMSWVAEGLTLGSLIWVWVAHTTGKG